MKESELLGKLMPGHPDILPIIENIREKYQLPEVDPEGEPIKEIYLVDKLISLEEFLYDLQSMVVSQTSFLRLKFHKQSV